MLRPSADEWTQLNKTCVANNLFPCITHCNHREILKLPRAFLCNIDFDRQNFLSTPTLLKTWNSKATPPPPPRRSQRTVKAPSDRSHRSSLIRFVSLFGPLFSSSPYMPRALNNETSAQEKKQNKKTLIFKRPLSVDIVKSWRYRSIAFVTAGNSDLNEKRSSFDPSAVAFAARSHIAKHLHSPTCVIQRKLKVMTKERESFELTVVEQLFSFRIPKIYLKQKIQ